MKEGWNYAVIMQLPASFIKNTDWILDGTFQDFLQKVMILIGFLIDDRKQQSVSPLILQNMNFSALMSNFRRIEQSWEFQSKQCKFFSCIRHDFYSDLGLSFDWKSADQLLKNQKWLFGGMICSFIQPI